MVHRAPGCIVGVERFNALQGGQLDLQRELTEMVRGGLLRSTIVNRRRVYELNI